MARLCIDLEFNLCLNGLLQWLKFLADFLVFSREFGLFCDDSALLIFFRGFSYG
jgi:hypothetical protein